MRSKLERFPEIVKADISRRQERIVMQAKPSFDQYVALQHALEEAGGAIQMFHPRYLVPQAYYAALGVKDRDPEKLLALEAAFRKVPGVRSAIIDQDRWFTNEQGIHVGGIVLFADKNPRLELRLAQVAQREGVVYEPRHHGHAADDHDEWSEMNHAFAGLCLIVLAVLGMLQAGLKQPPGFVRYGSAFVWLALFVFLFIRSDRNAWPLGELGWLESFQEWDTLQHRLGIGLLLAIAVGDFFRIRRGWTANPTFGRWGILVLGLVGSGMLFTHLHTTIDPAHYAMVRRMNAQHLAMATAVLLFALSKFAWDTWQVPKRGGRYLWLACLGALGVILNLYVE